jgi:hypothetical protein
MNKFGDLSIGALIVLFILVILEVYYYIDNTDYSELTLKSLDKNGDGKVSRSELRFYLTEVEKKKRMRVLKTSDIKRSIVGGVARGFLMGLILDSAEGGIVLGLILGIVNPILMGAEKMIL